MLKARGNRLTKLTTAIVDVIVTNLVFFFFRIHFPDYVPRPIFYGTKSAMVILAIAVIITSILLPPIIHYRRIRIEHVIKRNIIYTASFMTFFVVVCRMMTRSDHFITFGVTLGGMMFVAILITRMLEKFTLNKLRALGRNTKTVLFVGNDPANLAVYNDVISDITTGYRVLGYYSDGIMENAPESLKKLGSREDFRQMMASENNNGMEINELFCSISHDEAQELRSIIEFCNRKMIHFFYVPRIFQNIQMSLHAEMLGDSVVFTNYHEPLQQSSNKLIKRAFDILVSSVVLICMLPFIPIIALIIKIQSPGPLFFAQDRTGLNGKTFRCYKFRSMHVNADADKLQATKDDPRKFPFGNFMRKTNIDEFPQFWNVLKGNMSIVGPRPHMLFHTEKYSALIDKYMVRHFSKPGITGWAQVTGFRGETEELWQMEGRIKKDIWYIEHWSLWLDIRIIFLTAWSIVRPDKAAY